MITFFFCRALATARQDAFRNCFSQSDELQWLKLFRSSLAPSRTAKTRSAFVGVTEAPT